MNNRRNRVTDLTLVSVSLLAIIGLAVPWADEYLRLRRDAAELTQLEQQSREMRQRATQLDKIETKLIRQLEEMNRRSIEPEETEMVRHTIVEIVRNAGGRVRRLEIPEGERRTWADRGDDARNSTMPIYAEESAFQFHTHHVDLQVDGSLKSIQQILEAIIDQGWLMTTRGLTMTPTSVRESPVSLELHLVLYGLTPRPQQQPEEFALRRSESQIH